MTAPEYWRKCTTCKKLIAFGQRYWICSVSTCNRVRTGLVFCDVACFDAHVPVLNHKDAGAYEKKAPSLADWQRENAAPAPQPRASGNSTSPPAPVPAVTPSAPPATASSNSRPPTPQPSVVLRRSSSGGTSHTTISPTPQAAPQPADDLDREILVVASKVKDYIRWKSGMSTSDAVMAVLSRFVRAHARDGIRRAGKDGRKTVMDRDL